MKNKFYVFLSAWVLCYSLGQIAVGMFNLIKFSFQMSLDLFVITFIMDVLFWFGMALGTAKLILIFTESKKK